MENFKTRILDASDYHKDHPYMKSLDKVLSNYVATRSLIAQGQYETCLLYTSDAADE